jgi:serine/threonine protein kinase
MLINAHFDYSTTPKTLLNPDETFEDLRQLGKGSQGTSQLVRDVSNERLYVIKYLPYRNKKTYRDVQHEVEVLKMLSSYPNCNKDISCYYDDFQLVGEEGIVEDYCILMEYIEGTTLEEKVKENTLSLRNILEIAVWLTDVVARLHARGIAHGDIAPNNIMITPSNDLKLIDFDLSCLTEGESQTIPNCEEGESAEEDVFDTGVVLYEIANNNKRPYSKRNTVFNPSTFPIECYNNIVEQMIDLDEENRITSSEAHNLFQECLNDYPE